LYCDGLIHFYPVKVLFCASDYFYRLYRCSSRFIWIIKQFM